MVETEYQGVYFVKVIKNGPIEIIAKKFIQGVRLFNLASTYILVFD